MDIREWIGNLPGNPAPSQAAETAGIDKSTISRQLKRGTISAENVILLCRAHGKSPVDGLVETGYLIAAELEAGIPRALEQATNQQLLDKVSKRVDPAGRRAFHSGGITPNVDSPDEGESALEGLGRHEDMFRDAVENSDDSTQDGTGP